MINIAIVDDDITYSKRLKDYMYRFEKENRLNMEISVYSSGLALISEYEPIYDVILLDIEMPHMDGMEVARFIRKSDPHAVIVFITNMPQYAIKGYEVEAFDFIVKPVEYELFSLKLGAAIEAVDEETSLTIQIPDESGYRRVKADEIVFIEVKDHWLFVQSLTENYQMLGTLKEMEEKLETSYFIRCNKSYLINLQHVVRMRSDIVVLQGGYQFKISRSRRKEVQFAFIDYYSSKKF